MSIRDTVEHYLKPKDEEELDAFGLWAFGDKYKDYDHTLKFMEAWNEIHGDEYMLHPDGCMQLDVGVMVEMWKDEN